MTDDLERERGERDGRFEKWFQAGRERAGKEAGIETGFTREANDEPLYKIEPVAHSAVNTIAVSGGAVPPAAASSCNPRPQFGD